MITNANFQLFEPAVLEAVEELFQLCHKNEYRENDFLVFLENGHFDSKNGINGYSPFSIGLGREGMKDNDRMAFIEFFTSIPFEKNYNNAISVQEKFDIWRNSVSFSMMVYTHFWESKVFLRKLKILALMIEGKEYDWHLICRPTNTYNFIKSEIRDIFESAGVKFYDIIKKAYRSQIRNAFAHSDYYLSDGKIYLENYDSNDKYTVEYLTKEEFDEIIIITLLIHHCMTIKEDEYKKKLGIVNPDRNIYVPENGGELRTLHYRMAGSMMRWLWSNQIKGIK